MCYHNVGDFMKQEIIIFCCNLKYLREVNGLSKRKMAAKLNVGVKTLTHLESGILPKRLSCEILFHIKKEFNINPSDMFLPLN